MNEQQSNSAVHVASDSGEQTPAPTTIAAVEFQLAWLLNDRQATLNWHGREVVVNEPGGLAKKYERVRRIARASFPSRGDVDDVLNRTIDDYELGGWSNPFGFWTAFKRDMLDTKKAASERKRAYLDHVERAASDGIRRAGNSYEWAISSDAARLQNQIAQKWLLQEAGEIHGSSVAEKWQLAKASERPLDRLICEAVRRVMADDGYMHELATTTREAAKLARLVAEIRSLEGCSQAEAYRLLTNFKNCHSSGWTRA